MNQQAHARARARHRRIGLSAVAAIAAKCVSMGAALITVPLALHYLGAERYGMWMTMSSLIVMLAFADFGLGNGLLNAVADAYGRDDTAAMRAYVSSGFFALLGVAIVLLALFALAWPLIEWSRIFNVTGAQARAEAGPAAAVLIACFALAVPVSMVQRVQMGLQRGFLTNIWQIFGSLVGLGGLLAVIHGQGALPWLVLALAGAPLLAGLLNAALFFLRLRPDLAPSWRAVSWPAMQRILRTGLLFFVLQLVVAVAYTSDNIVIAQLLGASAVADYAVPERLFSIVTMLLGLAMAQLWPAYGEAIARGDAAWVRRTLVRSLLAALVLSSFASIGLMLLAPRIVQLWVGSAVNVSNTLLISLGIWKIIEAGGIATAAFLNGLSALRVQVVFGCCMAALAMVLKLVLVPRIGIAGAVLATIIAYLSVFALPISIYIHRKLTMMRNHT